VAQAPAKSAPSSAGHQWADYRGRQVPMGKTQIPQISNLKNTKTPKLRECCDTLNHSS
jgi:hypothetical protein